MPNAYADSTALVRLSPGEAVRKLLSAQWDGLLPVDPVAIARKLGLRVQPKNSFEPDSEAWSGRFDASQRLIEFDSSEALVRQRFTIAHELGHSVLKHGSRFRDLPEAFSSRNRDPFERDANQFAAELLMPEDAVRKAIYSGKFSSADDLASTFNVSKVAMAYRVSNLDLANLL